jgi:hypothetical protein
MHTDHGLAGAPLTDLFPGLTPNIEERLIQIADLLDRARLPDDHAEWQWSEEHVVDEVACWGTPDHNMHAAQETEWLAGTPEALAVAFAAASDTIRTWLRDSHEPSTWRARAGLPNPP